MRRLTALAGGAVACMLLVSVAAQGQATWWDANYTECEQIHVKAGAAAVPDGYTVSLTFDHAALVTAGDSLASGDDVRVVYWDGAQNVELDRVLNEGSSWNDAATMIWFRTQAAIAADGTDSEYYLYYGNASAASPPADKANVYEIWDDFDDTSYDPPWTAVDLDGASAGDTTEDNGQLHVSGRGKDIWHYASEDPPETYDQQRFVYHDTTFSEDVLIEAKLDNATWATEQWAKISVMVKDTAVAESNYAFAGVTKDHGVQFQWNYDNSDDGAVTYTLPRYLRVTRVGDVASGYDSTDCVNWTQIGASGTVTYADPVVVGLSSTAHNDAETVTGDWDWFKARKYVDPEPVCVMFTQIAVTPDPIYCVPDGSADVTAEPQDQLGNPFPATVTWSTDYAGVATFTPPTGTTDATNTTTTSQLDVDATEDTCTVTATATYPLPTGGPMSDRTVEGTAVLEVAAPFLSSVTVTPDSASILTTDTLPLVAAPVDQGGDAIAATVTWEIDDPAGGTLSSDTGTTTTFTPTDVEGVFVVTATATLAPDVEVATATIEVLLAGHLRINCGYNTYTPAGWEDDDAYRSGGNDYENWPTPGGVDPTGVANAAPYDVYQTVRHVSPHTYTISVSNGHYIVRLHLGDGYQSGGVPAHRDVTYVIEGTTVEDHMDYSTEAGAPAKALVRDYIVNVTDGDIVIECIGNSSDVFEAGLEIIPLPPPELASVVVTPNPAYCLPSDSVVLTAETLDQYGDPFTGTVTWTVSGGGTLSDTTGTTTTFNAGTTEDTFQVTAEATDGTNTFPDTADVIVAAPRVTTVNVTPQTAAIGTTDTLVLTVETLDQFGDPISASVALTVTPTDPTLTPSSGTTDAATGTMTTTFEPDPSIEDTYTVTATSDGVPGTAEVTVSDAPRVATVVVVPATATVAPGDPLDYTVATADQFGDPISADVTMSIDDPSAGAFLPPTFTTAGTGTGTTIFTADAAASGVFTVTATSGSASDTATLVISGTAALTTINVYPATVTMSTDGTQNFTVEKLDQFGQPIAAAITWSVSGDGTLSNESDSGVTYTASSTAGTDTLTATSGAISGSAEITVEVPVLTTITVSPATVTIATDGTQDFTVEKLDQFGQSMAATITWSVSGDGTLSNETDSGVTYTASSTAGTDALTATSGAVSGTADITVETTVLTTIRLTPSSPEIDVNGSVTFTAEPLDQFGDPFPATVTWTVSGGGSLSTDTGLTTTFTSNGSDGDFTVTATADGQTKTAKVTVLATLTGLAIGEGCVPVSAGAGWGAVLLAAALFGLGRHLRKARARGRRHAWDS